MSKKLWPHILTATSDARKMVQAGSTGIVTLDLGLVAEYLAINPNLLVIGRVHSPYDAQSQWTRGMAAKDAARQFVDDQSHQYELNPLIKLWEGHNEPSFGSPDDPKAVEGMKWYAEFEMERMLLMANRGLWCVIGGFSTGYPEVPENNGALWQAFLPALQMANVNECVLGLHEYSSPWLWWMTGKYQMQPSPDSDEGWTTLRYRKVRRQVLEPNNLLKLEIAITELGMERISPVPAGASSGNWRTNGEWWTAANSSGGPVPFDPDPGVFYARQLAWYGRELDKDDYVLGAAIFTAGHIDPAWENYDIANTSVMPELLKHIQGGVIVPEPTPVPLPGENLLVNGSFELGHATDENGNEIPAGWNIKSYGLGDTLRFPTKMQQGRTIPAVATAPGEYVIKQGGPNVPSNLPPVEWKGAHRALILDGINNYKIFAGGNPGTFAMELWQEVSGLVPGRRVRLTFPVCGESSDTPGSPTGKLEDDHFRCSVSLDLVTANRRYFEMAQTFDVAGCERPWNIIRLDATVPPSGKVTVLSYFQQNWPGVTDFFLDNISLIYLEDTPPEEPPIDLSALIESSTNLKLIKGNLEADLAELDQEIVILDDAIRSLNAGTTG